MPDAPLVSVLMPVYNGEQYLRPAIDSILEQTFTDFEFIIINDGSTDSTEQIILSYSDQRIRYIRNEKNLKLIATLNKGLDLCTGKYIARMDADDISAPERFATQVKFMEANPEYGLCGTDIEVMGGIQSWVQIGDNDFIRFCLLFHNPFCHPTVFMRTSIIRENKIYYPAEYIHAEEYMLWPQILDHAKCINLEERLLKYRFHDGQVSSVFRKDQFQMGQRIRLDLLREMVLFTTPGTRKAHLVIADLTGKELLRTPFEKITFDFKGWATVFQLQLWIFSLRVSLPFKKKWDTVYLRQFIAKVEDAVRLKKKQEGNFLKRQFSRIRNKTKIFQDQK
jgi:glycosyltransferase involved in cell wall biosynthesis